MFSLCFWKLETTSEILNITGKVGERVLKNIYMKQPTSSRNNLRVSAVKVSWVVTFNFNFNTHFYWSISAVSFSLRGVDIFFKRKDFYLGKFKMFRWNFRKNWQFWNRFGEKRGKFESSLLKRLQHGLKRIQKRTAAESLEAIWAVF